MPTTTIQAAPPEHGSVRVLEQPMFDLAVLTADYRPGVISASDSGVVVLGLDYGDENPAKVVLTVSDMVRILAAVEESRRERRPLRRDPESVPAHERIEP